MGKSINPMSTSKIRGEAVSGSAPSPIALKRDSFAAIVLMSLQPAIPWWVALLRCPPPLHRPDSIFHPPAETVNHHLTRAGEFSTGRMRNFQPELTRRFEMLAAGLADMVQPLQQELSQLIAKF